VTARRVFPVLWLALLLASAGTGEAQTHEAHAERRPPKAEANAPRGTPNADVDPQAPTSGAEATGHVHDGSTHSDAVAAPRLPEVTEEMRRAAFPDVHGHAAHDQLLNGFVLFDQLEWRSGNGPGTASWSNTGWVGGDVNRVWFRTEGDGADGRMHEARAHVLYGRAVARWWDVVAGVRQDIRPGAQTWLAVGVQGLAPGFFEVEATAYLSDEGQTAAHLEVEHDLLVTNRIVLQPVIEVDLYGKPNASLGVGSGVSTGEAGIRLRYQFTREFAPYVGVSWVRAFGDTADVPAEHGSANGAPRLVTGVRVWF
jgi:copper resistance protein B